MQEFIEWGTLLYKYTNTVQCHALKSELNKVWYGNFIKFKYDGSNPPKEWAFEKTNEQCFYLHLTNSNCKAFFHTLSWTSKRNYFISEIYTKFMFYVYISYCHKNGQKLICFKKFNFLWNQLDAIVFLHFPSHTPPPKKKKNFLPPNGQK